MSWKKLSKDWKPDVERLEADVESHGQVVHKAYEERIANLQAAVEELGMAMRLAEASAKNSKAAENAAKCSHSDAVDRLQRMQEYLRRLISDARDLDAAKSIARRAQEL